MEPEQFKQSLHFDIIVWKKFFFCLVYYSMFPRRKLDPEFCLRKKACVCVYYICLCVLHSLTWPHMSLWAYISSLRATFSVCMGRGGAFVPMDDMNNWEGYKIKIIPITLGGHRDPVSPAFTSSEALRRDQNEAEHRAVIQRKCPQCYQHWIRRQQLDSADGRRREQMHFTRGEGIWPIIIFYLIAYRSSKSVIILNWAMCFLICQCNDSVGVKCY